MADVTVVWPHYRMVLGYHKRDDVVKEQVAFVFQAPNDDAAESAARRMADALYGFSAWGPAYRVEPTPASAP